MRTGLGICVLLLGVASALGGEAKITVEEPSGVRRECWPVTSGVPLPQGALADPGQCVLLAADGSQVELQAESLARWPDGSVRWLLLDFQVDLDPGQKKAFTLGYGADVKRCAVENRVRLTETKDGVVLDSGPMQVKMTSKRFRLLDAVWLDRDGDGSFGDDERVTSAESGALVLKTPDGKAFRSDLADATMTVEQTGPLRACVRFEGHHASADGTMFRYIVRLHAFRGKSTLKVWYTLVNDVQDVVMAKFDSLDWGVSLGDVNGELRQLVDGKPCDGARLVQIDESHYEVDGKAAGNRPAGWAAVGNGKLGMALGVREFWQNWPKAVEARDGRLVLGICPDFPQGVYDDKSLKEQTKLYYYLRDGVYTLKVGAARTHELWATFFAGKPKAERLAELFRAAEEPLLATCDPAYVCQTRVLGDFPPADPGRYAGYDDWIERALKAHLARRDKEREYGMLNYGDWYGERGVNWGNLEYDLAHGMFLEYLRTGNRAFFSRAEQAARHHIDVDVIHAVNPQLKNPGGSPPEVGEVWLHCCGHTGGYFDDPAIPVGRPYQMGHSKNCGHIWVDGDLEYFFLTGDRLAWEISLQIADTMARQCPTSYGTHIRTLGWPLNLVMAAYEATGDPKYLEAAHKEWNILREKIDWEKGWVVRLARDHCLHPPGSKEEDRDRLYRDQRCQGNVPFMTGLTLCALARYHRVTGDPEVLRAISVGLDQMIHDCWDDKEKGFRYTTCPLMTKPSHTTVMLAADALAYEAALTGNQEHLRVLREGMRAALPKDEQQDFGKGLSQMIHFAPYGLKALEP